MIEPQTLRFLSQLKKNNNKPWFDSHRVAYEAARIDFGNFIQLLIDALQKQDPSITGLTARDCLFRINRDIRFSNDKTPYKSNFGASIKRGGRKSGFAGYYFHLEPGASFVGGGLWMPDAPKLKMMRQEIDYNWEEFSGIIGNKGFKKLSAISTTAPTRSSVLCPRAMRKTTRLPNTSSEKALLLRPR
jgi:uncharacterized protein (TIGR02453 family)